LLNDWYAWYAAPKAHDNVYTSKSDVFSFALILYEILMNKSGFSRMSKAYTRAEWTKAEKSDRLGNGMRTT
jgi:hypothetical protein